MSRISKRRFPLAAAALALTFGVAPALACPLCSEETEQQAKETGVNASMGYALSILMMIALPVSMVGGLGYALYRQQQQSTANRDEQSPQQPN